MKTETSKPIEGSKRDITLPQINVIPTASFDDHSASTLPNIKNKYNTVVEHTPKVIAKPPNIEIHSRSYEMDSEIGPALHFEHVTQDSMATRKVQDLDSPKSSKANA